MRRQQQGLTLIEMMIAGVLSLLVMLALVSIFFNAKTNYNIQEGLARMQESARFATFYTNKIIRMAGYQGCSNQDLMTVTNMVKDPGSWSNFDNPVLGYEATGGAWSPALPANLTGIDIKPGTDVLEIRKASDLGVQLSQDMTQANSAINLVNGTRLAIEQNDVVIITDCEVGDIFMVGNSANAASLSHSANNNNSSPASVGCPSNNNCMSKAYKTDAQVMRYEYFAIYVKDTGRTNNAGNPIYALVVQDVNGVEREVGEGVDDLQLMYGVDTTNDGSADNYQTATAVNAAGTWGDVKSINIKKLFGTTNEVVSTPQTYTFDGVTTTPTDRQLRREWSNFITLRNRSFP